MNTWRRYLIGIWIASALWWGWGQPSPAMGAVDTEKLAQRIAESLINLRGKGRKYKTIAFSRIRVFHRGDLDLNELIDYATTKILQTVLEIDVIDRGQLQRVLREQKFQLSDIVSADEYKELGKLAGVDLFIYGSLYKNALILKAIDVQSSVIAWADAFPIGTGNPGELETLARMGKSIVASMKNNPRLKRAKIRTISFWNFRARTDINEEEVIDFLTVHITRDGSFAVVDRNNLKLILGEQSLNQRVYFDEKSAAELGGLFGVQAFIHGNLKRDGGKLVADLKMTDIHTGKFVWAAILKVDEGGGGGGPSSPSGPTPAGMVQVAAGTFVQGTNKTPAEARPPRQVKLAAYHIDVTEVTNGEYQKFIKAKSHRAPVGWVNNRFRKGEKNLPVTGVTWDDARDYCRFVGKRMPTEAEWEKAARGNGGQNYPWTGANFVSGYAVTRESGRQAAVSAFEAGKDISPYGAKHMAGNVREWVKDIFRAYDGGSAANAKFGKERVVRGSSWAQNGRLALTFYRGSSKRNLAWPDVGFRCAKTAVRRR